MYTYIIILYDATYLGACASELLAFGQPGQHLTCIYIYIYIYIYKHSMYYT